LNSANVVLIPKKEGSQDISDFRPFSIMHSIGKILTKVLSNRLAPKLNQIVFNCQSAFIKGRSIHNNFQYVRGAVKHFHEAKMLVLLLKLDIAKVFNNVRWDYLLEVVTQLGFR
jgi:retron-type reverse transcriptase